MSDGILEEGPFGFFEFFAGGGMARLGLGDSWKCLFANDFDAKKVASYRANFYPASELVHGDIAKIKTNEVPGNPSLAWASFPCQDLSLAGAGRGLKGERSGTFWSFLNLVRSLQSEGRNPPIIALENVYGLITSHEGQDLANLVSALAQVGYRVGVLSVDGALFVAQSRPRVFVIAVSRGIQIPKGLTGKTPNPCWHPKALTNVVENFPSEVRKSWIWWKLPMPDADPPVLSEIIEHEPQGVDWHSPEETKRLLEMMAPGHLEKVQVAIESGEFQVGTIYKRTRGGVQRAEVRFDGVSGCLRTPSGGSSRQIIMVVNGTSVRTRLISPRETARLMGLPDYYVLPQKYNDAYHLTGDGVVVPAVSWLEQHILAPLASNAKKNKEKLRI